MSINPYDPSNEIVRAELVPKRNSLAPAIRAAMLLMVVAGTLATVGLVARFGVCFSIDMAVVVMVGVAIVVAVAYRLVGIYC